MREEFRKQEFRSCRSSGVAGVQELQKAKLFGWKVEINGLNREQTLRNQKHWAQMSIL